MSIADGSLNNSLKIASTLVNINADGDDMDFVVEGDTDPALFRTDAFNDRVGIGTTNPTHKLTVNGYISAEEVAVVPDVPADFVFEDDFDLRSLEEVEQYIDVYGHLPEIPSAAEMKADGVGLAAMQMKLLQKIEELTLYLIAQNKVLTAMQEESALVKERLIALEAAGN